MANGSTFLLVIGEHDKGLGEPFSLRTVSGRRLRAITATLGVTVAFANMATPRRTTPTKQRIVALQRQAERAAAVIFLGRRVEQALRPHIPSGRYLPHPAARRRIDAVTLRNGLTDLARGASTGDRHST
jgi:hypothetical protein